MVCTTAARKRAKPYTNIIVEGLSQMRREAVQLVRQAVGLSSRSPLLYGRDKIKARSHSEPSLYFRFRYGCTACTLRRMYLHRASISGF